jgi:hypothetical protein
MQIAHLQIVKRPLILLDFHCSDSIFIDIAIAACHRHQHAWLDMRGGQDIEGCFAGQLNFFDYFQIVEVRKGFYEKFSLFKVVAGDFEKPEAVFALLTFELPMFGAVAVGNPEICIRCEKRLALPFSDPPKITN